MAYIAGLSTFGLIPRATLEWLDKAFHERSDMLVYLKADFRLDPIRNDSRFMHLGRKLGIPES